jgi:hypothetical protein
LGVEGESKLLHRNLGENGLVGWLRNEAYDPDVPERIKRQDYADMATVIELMIRERLEELEEEQPNRQQKNQSASPFFRIGDDEKTQSDTSVSSDPGSHEVSSDAIEDTSTDDSVTPWQTGS